MKETTLIRDMTHGPVVSQLLRFTMPLFISNALQAVYNLVDMVVVGNYIGKAGMSAVSIGGDILHLLTFVSMGFASAGQVIIAQAVGSKQPDTIKKTIGTMFSFLLAASVAIAVLCYGLRTSILGWLNTSAASWQYTMDYMITCICGLVFIYGYGRVNHILVSTLSFTLGLATVMTLIMLLIPGAVYGMFTTDADVLALASVLTVPIICNFYGAATRSGAFSLINGSGRARLNLAVAMIDGVVGRIGLAALLGFALHLNCFGFWMGDALAGFVPLFIRLMFYLSGWWKQQ